MQQSKEAFFSEFLAGNIASWSAITVEQPLDYAKVQLQVRDSIPSFTKIYQMFGLRGFYRGASSLYLTYGVISALEFYALETICRMMCLVRDKVSMYSLQISDLFIAGALTGTWSALLRTPIQYAKIQSQVSKQQKPTGSIARIMQILIRERVDGVRNLYTGLSWTILRQIPGSAIYYGVFHSLMKYLNKERQKANPLYQMLAGGLAGFLYQFYSYPFDTIKTNIQSREKTFLELMKTKFWLHKSYRKGLKITCCKDMIITPIYLTVYEHMRHCMLKSRKF